MKAQKPSQKTGSFRRALYRMGFESRSPFLKANELFPANIFSIIHNENLDFSIKKFLQSNFCILCIFLGACPRMKSLLRKIHFGHIWCKFSLNRTTIRLKFTPNLPQNGFPSLRLPFSDSLLAKMSTAVLLFGCTFHPFPK